MAVEFKAEHTRTAEYLFLPKDIKFKAELNGRYELPDIEPLIDSMVKRGQLQPVLIRKDGDQAILVAGFSRWRAAVEINKRKLTPESFRLRCVYVKCSEQEGVLSNIAENRFRNSTTPIDDAHNIARCERYGMTLEEIATHFRPVDDFGIPLEEKKAVKWVRDRLALIGLTNQSVEAMRNGSVKPNAAKVLATLSEEQQAFAIKQAKKSNTPLTAASLKAPKAPKAPKVEQTSLLDAPKVPASAVVETPKGIGKTLYNAVASIAEGGEIPFPWEFDVDARKFCKELLKAVNDQRGHLITAL